MLTATNRHFIPTEPENETACHIVNDVHSQLNRTEVRRVAYPSTVDELRSLLADAQATRRAVSIAGGRHAMGGQQFASHDLLIDMTRLTHVLEVDRRRGLVTVEAGIEWPNLVERLNELQPGTEKPWGIVQKQTGADRLSLGGALSANVHGRGLRLPPIVSQIESFLLLDASGTLRHCSRSENADLFRLAIGGYGLVGIVYALTLRLARRQKVQRRVTIRTVDELMGAFEERIAEGFECGDFQFAIDPRSPEFLRTGILSCYRPVADDTPMPRQQRVLSRSDWGKLAFLAHHDKSRAFEIYSRHYVATDGQIYWSDLHQLSEYLDDYHVALDQLVGATDRSTEMITELYVPRAALASFLDDVRTDFCVNDVDLIYGTIRLIERDTETFLAWARERWVCVVLNLHVTHTPGGLARARRTFRRLIDMAIKHGGSYYLTYHRWATRRQVEACYPQFEEFLHLKRRHDPDDRFQSDWYRHYAKMFKGPNLV